MSREETVEHSWSSWLYDNSDAVSEENMQIVKMAFLNGFSDGKMVKQHSQLMNALAELRKDMGLDA